MKNKSTILIFTLLFGAAVFMMTDSVSAATTTTKYFNGHIAFVKFDEFGNNPEVYIMNSNGSNEIQLTDSNPAEYNASLSRDGSKVAFEIFTNSDMEIHSMNADGSGETPLTNNTDGEADPAWSPDGSKIAFVTNRDGNDEIYVMNADGSNPTRLTNNAVFDSEPSWSPDGSKIAFVNYTGGDSEIYVMNADGSSPAPLTTNAADDYSPSWSPDGSKIAFVTSRDSNEEIYTMNSDGSSQTRITNTVAEEEYPSYSPDGTKLLTTVYPDDNYDSSEVYVMNIDGSNRTQLTNGVTYVTAPNPQPWQYLPYIHTTHDDGSTTATVSADKNYNFVDYTVPSNQIFVLDGQLGEIVVKSGATLSGIGSAATVTVQSGGILAPGNSPGCLASGNLILAGTYQAEIAGTIACTGYDQLQVTGTVNLTGSTLTPSLLNGFAPITGNTFTIITNDGTDPVTGTFQNLPEAATMTIGTTVFKISYIGGDGNDVTLTVQTVPGAPETGWGNKDGITGYVFIVSSIVLLIAMGVATNHKLKKKMQ